MSRESSNCPYRMGKDSANGVNFVNTAEADLGPGQKTMMKIFTNNGI